MNRPRHIWSVFALCSVVLLAVMGWASHTTLRLDRLQLEAAQAASLEEGARLALWRMDSWLAPLIIEESARPFADYAALAETPRAYTKSFTQLKQGDVLVPSPLLDFTSSHVLLHFQFHPDGRLTSPQVPTGSERGLAEAGSVSREHLERAAQRLDALRRILDAPASEIHAASGPLPALRSGAPPAAAAAINNGNVLMRETEKPPELEQVQTVLAPGDLPAQQGAAQSVLNAPATMAQMPAQVAEQQEFRNTAEFNFRANTFQQAQQRLSASNLKLPPDAPPPEAVPSGAAAGDGVFKAFWLGDALVLARRVNMGKSRVVQGAWLDWTNLQAGLLASIGDLFPAARLLPMREPNGERHARMLAALPVKLVTGDTAQAVLPRWTPLRLSLLLAWGCVLLAGLAIALLLHGTVALSERRAAFVSAVTHELRTPLTTFKMYSEMLAEGMVADEARRRSYLGTLCSEANRLNHLVENVLAYARLERGSARQRDERLTLGDLIERVKPRLRQRADQAAMLLAEDVDESARKTVVQVDVSAVEQILFNLVDNACKYAAPSAAEKIIHLEALPDHGRHAMLRVRDHGQGLSAEAARRLFQPFSKSALEAAKTAPGVGLGLALCRRLSRSMGGDLRWDALVRDGAGFVLLLPLTPGQRA